MSFVTLWIFRISTYCVCHVLRIASWTYCNTCLSHTFSVRLYSSIGKHFSILLHVYGVPTYVPSHNPNNVEVWSNVPGRDKNWGVDRNAHSLTHNNHIALRNQIVSKLIDRGWETVKNVTKWVKHSKDISIWY